MVKSNLELITIICLFLVPACLANDPPDQTLRTASQSSAFSFDINRTKAPMTLDSEILKHRAFNQSPMWEREVNSGKLPSVSDRLPETPRVIIPFKEIGTYGGKIRRAITGDIVQVPATMKAKDEGLLTFAHPMGDSIEPNLAERWEFRKEGKELYVYLREGIKWSDGHPFTSDDVLFYYNDLVFDEDARPIDRTVIPSAFQVEGKPIKLEKIDDLTLKFSADRPMGRILYGIANHDIITLPLHVYGKWHPRHNPAADYEEFRERATRAQFLYTEGNPTLAAWRPVKWVHGQRVVFERNPYDWKVDTAGNQLPYTDYLEFTVIPDKQVILLKFMNGELDFFGRYSQIDMFQTLKQGESETGNFTVYLSGPTPSQVFYLNWDAPDPDVREAFRNRDVRIALSVGLDREEINQVLYYGFLVPAGYSFYPPSPYYSEEHFKRYSEYDPDRANALLEAAGYRDTDGDGYREFKNGRRFEFTIDIVSAGGSMDITELVSSHWAKLGIKVYTFGALRDIIVPRRFSGDYEVHYWWFDGSDDPLQDRFEWAITGSNQPYWHRNADQEGPEWLHEATRVLELAATTTDPDKLRKYMIRARDLHTDEVAAIPLGAAYRAWGAHNRLGNVPEDVSFSETHGAWGRPMTLEQIFIRNQRH
ncbi:MAG: ABC transporter substrate-binding protein [Candidatus Latescibacterota bacterium]|nr:ABC transporter substrate-binding protein [Candidatus Latescibacterota bacterium]